MLAQNFWVSAAQAVRIFFRASFSAGDAFGGASDCPGGVAEGGSGGGGLCAYAQIGRSAIRRTGAVFVSRIEASLNTLNVNGPSKHKPSRHQVLNIA